MVLLAVANEIRSHVPSQRQRRDIDRQLHELRAIRDSFQIEANDNVPAETSGLEEAMQVRDPLMQLQVLGHRVSSAGHDSRKGVVHCSI